jgi:PadR family transcriptional regulator PadR
MAARDLIGWPRAEDDAKPQRPVRALPQPPAAGPDESPARPIRPRDEFVIAWLLLLLEGGATYGYQLRGELDAHSVSIDQAVVYRTLRKLEGDGWVTSRWVESGLGPRRRSYTVTPQGRGQLAQVAGVISAIRDLHDAFLDEHRRASERRRDRSA